MVLLEFRSGQLKIAQRELALQEEEVEFSLARVNDSDKYRTSTINGILSKLHQVEKNLGKLLFFYKFLIKFLGDSCLNNDTELKQAQSINRNKQAERNIAFGTVRISVKINCNRTNFYCEFTPTFSMVAFKAVCTKL